MMGENGAMDSEFALIGSNSEGNDGRVEKSMSISDRSILQVVENIYLSKSGETSDLGEVRDMIIVPSINPRGEGCTSERVSV